MTAFQFRAIGPDQRAFAGAIEAPSREAALRQLRARGALPISVEPSRSRATGRGKTLGAAAEAALFGDLAVLLKAGLVLDQALDLAAATTEGAANRRLAAAWRDQVRSGQALSEALVQGAIGVDPITLALVRAGEATGKLGEALGRLAELARERQAAADKLRAALTYPAMVLAASGLTVGFLLIVVVPAFAPMFEGGAAMPASLARLLWLRGLLVDQGPFLLGGLAAAALVLQRLARRPALRQRWHGWLLALPWLGPLLAAAEIGRFARALGGLLEAGVPLAGALPLAQATLRNQVLAAAIGQAGEAVRAGGNLSDALARAPRMPALVGHLLRVSEAAGAPAPMLLRIAILCEREVRRATERLLTLLPAVLIVGMGGLVAGIVSMLLGAVLDVNQLAF
jgi:general secretion pathway protein F